MNSELSGKLLQSPTSFFKFYERKMQIKMSRFVYQVLVGFMKLGELRLMAVDQCIINCC